MAQATAPLLNSPAGLASWAFQWFAWMRVGRRMRSRAEHVKVDKADAFALAEMLRTGWYSAVHVKSEESHRLKALLGARDQLVRAKSALGNQVRGLLRPFGIRLPSRQGTKKFADAAYQAVAHDAMLSASVTALMEALAAIEGQLARLDDRLKELARRSPVCWRLMSTGSWTYRGLGLHGSD